MYDLIIVGAGAAGMAAGIYGARGKLKTLIIEGKKKGGGQCATTSELENYPGYAATTGPQLMDDFRKHCEKFGVEFVQANVTALRAEQGGVVKVIESEDGRLYRGKSVALATGAEPRILGIKGELEFRGRGVAYCATCDADFYEDLDIVVVGSGNTAVEESVYLSKFVSKITMIVIHDEGTLDADRAAQEHAFNNEKINFVWNSVVDEICGDDLVTGVKLKNVKTGAISDLECSGVFMFVGTVPKTEFVKDQIDLTPQGYIKVGGMQETSMPGVFAAGDVVDKYLRQVVTAAADGATAAVAAGSYLFEEENWHEKVSSQQGTVLAAFWSPVVKESVELLNQLETLSKEKGVKLAAIDVYKNRFIATRYNISDIPTVVKFVDGEEQQRVVNATDTASVEAIL